MNLFKKSKCIFKKRHSDMFIYYLCESGLEKCFLLLP